MVTFQVCSLASSRNSLVGTASADSSQRWCVLKVVTNSFQNTFLGNTSSSRIYVLPLVLWHKILRSIAAIFRPRLSLATVFCLLLLPPANEHTLAMSPLTFFFSFMNNYFIKWTRANSITPVKGRCGTRSHYICIYLCMYIHMYICMYICKYIYVCIYLCICMCVVYIYI